MKVKFFYAHRVDEKDEKKIRIGELKSTNTGPWVHEMPNYDPNKINISLVNDPENHPEYQKEMELPF